MAQKKRRQQLNNAFLDMAQLLETCNHDDSDESMFLRAASFNHVSNSFQECTRTRNMCEDDVRLPLTRIDASSDYIFVWLHDGKPLDDDIQQDAEVNLQRVFANVQIFTNMEACLNFLGHLDPDHTRLIFVSSCFYNGRVCNFLL
jgi:hypothetical protein